ncbi:DUF488 domain-containing protein [Rhizobium sp. KVB221]|uniref:DUF488 domain-containing protein n=1 Tax=Rhizobium setariae TaxID=2801340 RepID=A0A936YME5_9HYPH|nr:DUF488 domain-containing protein [Rhizobium setariae]MBL0373078.1 DUF488 domain-containing protein [Rhizobium setariae]
MYTVHTIGFTNTTAEHFFDRLLASGSRLVIDVRLHNTSQLAGFAKATDLAYFLDRIAGIGYAHQSLLAPEEDMLKAFRAPKANWQDNESQFQRLMAERKIEEKLKPDYFADSCLLCSEDKPHHCHRRMILDYLNDRWGKVLDVTHL